jgi:alpha-1,3-glucan synthase
VAERTESLRQSAPSINIPESIFEAEDSRLSMFNDGESRISTTEFGFDAMLVHSRVYQRVSPAGIRRNRRSSYFFSPIEGDLIDFSDPVDNSEHQDEQPALLADLEGLKIDPDETVAQAALSATGDESNADVIHRPLPLSNTIVDPTPPVGKRTVLIATMEYHIQDWDIKIKIGPLGVMAQLISLTWDYYDLITVVPCVGGISYPSGRRAAPIIVQILGKPYQVNVQYHTINSNTLVLLDAPIFRQRSKPEPYPPRMDDFESAIYYSAWNQCIAETCKRFPIDIYYIGDFRGSLAPLYLLPETIPCCIHLPNAEIPDSWKIRSPREHNELCRIYNLSQSIVESYIQFGQDPNFNILYAGLSYLRKHQLGLGAFSFSNKYGTISFVQHPLFKGLSTIQRVAPPDPSDTQPWDPEAETRLLFKVDLDYERYFRPRALREAQEWAGLHTNPSAQLFVFVGRWVKAKGVDIIADCFPYILQKYPNAQLICVGPVLDLYGKFAALKLHTIVQRYPGRVYSKPEFTALPPYIFSGPEFALLPDRDESGFLAPIEFGRKGALAIGARIDNRESHPQGEFKYRRLHRSG